MISTLLLACALVAGNDPQVPPSEPEKTALMRTRRRKRRRRERPMPR